MDTAKIETAAISSGKKLAWNSLLNLLGQVIPMFVGIFAIHFLVHHLDGERFGVLTLVWAIIGYFSLFDFGLGRALTQLIATRLQDAHQQDLPDQINLSLLLMAVLGALGGVCLALFSTVLVQRFLQVSDGLQIETSRAFYWVALSIPLVVLTTGVRGVLEAQQSFGVLNWIRVALGIYMFLAPVMVVYFTPSLVVMAAFLTFGRLLALLAHIIACHRYSPYFHLTKFRQVNLAHPAIIPLLRTGGWMTISNLVSPLMVYLDRFLIGALISVAAVAYYVNPYEVVTRIWIIPSAIGSVLFPAFALHFGKNNERVAELFGQGLKVIFLLTFPMCLITLTFAFEGLNLWLGATYASNSTFVAQWMAVGVFVNCLAQVAFMLLQAAGHSHWTAKLHLIELPIYLFALCFGLKFYGINGAAIAWVGRVCIDTVFLFIIATRVLASAAQQCANMLKLLGGALFAMIVCMQIDVLQYKIFGMLSALFVLNYFAWATVLTAKEKQILSHYLGGRFFHKVE